LATLVAIVPDEALTAVEAYRPCIPW
jgi:hypothetical protein